MITFEKSINQLTHMSTDLKRQIKDIENNGDVNWKEEYQTITLISISFLKNHGRFIKSEADLYYFCNLDRRLYKIGQTNFSYMISEFTWINLTESVFKFMLTEIKVMCNNHWDEVDIKKFSYYDNSSNTLYIFNNGNKIIKITEDKISEIFNWEEWIIFLWWERFSEWSFKEETNDTEKQLLCDLINSLSLDEWLYLSKNEQKKVLVWYIYSLFFPSLQSNRPIITFIWEKGSGKTFFLEMLLLIFTGNNNSISNLPSKEDDLKTNFLNEYLCYFDNVDEKVPESKLNILCSVATGSSIKMRKLYTNSEQISIKNNCFLWITSRNPTFKRDDFADRLLLFFLKRRDGFDSDYSIKEKFNKNRDGIMSTLCLHLQEKLKDIKHYKKHKTPFRISDFANFAMNINKWEEDKVVDILKKLQLNQQELATQTDTLLELINSIIEMNNKTNTWKKWTTWELDWFIEWKAFKAQELHRFFYDHAKNQPYLTYSFRSVHSLWKTLSNNINAYKLKNILISKTEARSNVQLYAISKIRSDDELG